MPGRRSSEPYRDECRLPTRRAWRGVVAPPLAHTLRLDRSALALAREGDEDLFFTRVQAVARSRYPLMGVNQSNATVWQLELQQDPKPADVVEGRLLRVTGRSNRPFVVQSVGATAAGRPTVGVVSYCSYAGSGISPAGITLEMVWSRAWTMWWQSVGRGSSRPSASARPRGRSLTRSHSSVIMINAAERQGTICDVHADVHSH